MGKYEVTEDLAGWPDSQKTVLGLPTSFILSQPRAINQPRLVGKSAELLGPERNSRSNSVLNLTSWIVY